MLDIKVGINLYADWRSRGLLHETKIDTVRLTKTFATIRVTPNVLRGLVDDALLQIEPQMSPSSSWVRTCSTFIDRALIMVESSPSRLAVAESYRH